MRLAGDFPVAISPRLRERSVNRLAGKVHVSDEQRRFRFEDATFLAVILIVTVLFGLVVSSFFGAILWALVLAILFAPINRRLLRAMPGRSNSAALLTLLLIILIVILPAVFLGSALIQELLTVYGKIQAGQIDIAALFDRATGALPGWALEWLRKLGWGDFAAVRRSLSNTLTGSFGALAGQALQIGQRALQLILMLGVMTYLAFFLIRDGESLGKRVIDAIPLDHGRRSAIVRNFTVVIRATIKGSLVVAIVQGLIGGIAFWALGIQGALLWGTLMGVFSLIPAIGTGIIWLPVALYLLATGAVAKGLILTAIGVLIISMVDNVLRPLLVGRDTRMPDYVVLISTLGGLEAFGFHGFIIGPVVAALFIGTWNILTETRRQASG